MSSLQELLNPVYEVGAFGLELAAYATFSAALLAVIVLAINLLFRRWMTARQMNLLWALVLVRLMLPIGPPSSLSLQGAVVKPARFSSQLSRAPHRLVCKHFWSRASPLQVRSLHITHLRHAHRLP